MRFYQTFAIINAIWATYGEFDSGSLILAALAAWCLWRLHQAEKIAEEQAA